MKNEEHWRKWYRHKENRQDEPSAFAKWARPRMAGKVVYDLGCGNGRDTDYLAKKHYTIGVDPFAPKGLNYENLDWRRMLRKYPVTGEDTLYARFFFHAITEAEQEEILRRWRGELFSESREVDGDHDLENAHWRRPINAEKFNTHLIDLGYDIIYSQISSKFSVKGDDKPLLHRVHAVRWT